MEIIAIAIIAFVTFKFGFGGILTSWYRKADAATAVQNLLEHQKKVGFFQGDPARTAGDYVQAAWDFKPNIFDGKFDRRPHKLAVVVYSLALAVKRLDALKHEDFGPVMIALGNAISEIEVNGSYYPLTTLDHSLFNEAIEMIAPIMAREARAGDALFAELEKASLHR